MASKTRAGTTKTGKTKILAEAQSRITPQLLEIPEGAMTTYELAKALGVGETTVKHFVNGLRAEGKLREAKVRVKRNGYWTSIKVYWME